MTETGSTHLITQQLGSEDHVLKKWYEDYMQTPGNNLGEESTVIQAVISDELDADFIEQRILESTPKSPVEAVFCLKCRNLFNDWPTLGASSTRCHDSSPTEDHGWEYATTISYSTWALEASARAGCRFCSYVLQGLKDDLLLDIFRKIEARLLRLDRALECSLSAQNWGTNPIQLLWLNLPGKECTSCNAGIAASARFESRFLPVSADCYETTRDVLDIASTWLRECSETHELCQRSEEGLLPTRLISLVDKRPRLILTAEQSETLHYATLSHSWGDHDVIKLTSNNLRCFLEEIPLDDLPRTFTEAMEITKSLGLRYLWIDSLCIVQNDAVDWEKESGMMTSVYGGSTINIAASSARDSTEGCFMKPPGFVAGLRARITDGGRQRVQDFWTPEEYDRSTFGTHLGTRAWALQEKLLSPRTIHFSNRGAFWECKSMIASEHLPDANPGKLLSPLVRRKCKLVEMWCQIVGLYSAANLTFGKDKLPALSGIAQQAYKESGDQYLAGLWRGRILEQLCWFRLKSNSLVERPLQRAPTWTWASIEGKVAWRSNQNGKLKEHARVLSASTTLSGHDLFGQVARGVIRLACSAMVTGHLPPPNDPAETNRKAFTITLAGNAKEEFTIRIDTLTDLRSIGTTQIHLLPILSGKTGNGYRNDGDEKIIQESLIEGIVINATNRTKGEYIRVGSFHFYKNRIKFRLPESTDGNNPYDRFLELLEQHGKSAAEAACAEIISASAQSSQRFIVTLV